MDGDKSCQIFPAKLFLPFAPSANRKLTKPPGDREGQGDRLLPRARRRRPVVKALNSGPCQSVDLHACAFVRSCLFLHLAVVLRVIP